MSQVIILKRSCVFAAATAIGAAGFLTLPAPAQAKPMFPLAPACAEYGWPGKTFLNHTNGWTVEFLAVGPSVNGVSAQGMNPRAGYAIFGPMEGGIWGRNVDFRIHWDNNSRGHYTGTVGDDGIARGDSVDELSSARAAWITTSPVRCMKVEPAPPPPILRPEPAAPPPVVNDRQPPVDPPPPTTFTLKVVGEAVDVYDKPSHLGGKQIVVNGEVLFLQVGDLVQLVGDFQPQDWVEVSNPKIPGGKGFIWGHLDLP